MILEFVHHWEAVKDLLLPRNQYVRAIWHVHGGLLGYLSLTMLFNRPLYSRLPISTVWIAEFANELVDLRAHWPLHQTWIWRDTMGDIFNTLLWPTILFLYAAWALDRPPLQPSIAEASAERDGDANEANDL